MYAKESVNIDKITMELFFDGTPVSALPDSVHKLFPIYSSTKNTADSSAVISVRTFSSEENYFVFGESVGLKLREAEEYGQQIYEEATTRGLLDWPDDMPLPDDFIELNDIRYQEVFGTPRTAKTTASLVVYDDFIPYGTSTWLPLFSNPALFAWNNRISCYYRFTTSPTGIWGGTIFYDSKFYKDKLATIWTWAFSSISFHQSTIYWYVNNRTSSYNNIN